MESICPPENYDFFRRLDDFIPSIAREELEALPELQSLIEDKNETLEALGIIGLIIFALFYFKFNRRNSLLQKSLAVSWMIIGYKFYLEKGVFKLINCSKTNLVIGIINLVVGIILYSNFIELFKLKDNWRKNSFLGNLRQIFNFLFLNFSFEIYDIDKITNNLTTDQTFKLILNYVFLMLNTFPLMSNFFIEKRLFSFNFTLFPSPVALATLTIFLNFFRKTQVVNSKVFAIVNILCYAFLVINFVNDVLFLKIYSYEHFFFIILNILNLIFIYYFDIYNLNSGVMSTSSKI